MQTTTAPKAGNAPDLLQGILSVQVRNEDKITEQDRVYCQTQQNLLYKTLDQIDRWYAVFKEEAEQYQAERKFHYEENGKVSMRDFYTYHNDREDYSHNEFKPFDLINDLVDKNRNANAYPRSLWWQGFSPPPEESADAVPPGSCASSSQRSCRPAHCAPACHRRLNR